MKIFVFVIGSTDEFTDIDELDDAALNGRPGNYSVFSFPAESAEMAIMIGKARAFDADWSRPDTFWFVRDCGFKTT